MHGRVLDEGGDRVQTRPRNAVEPPEAKHRHTLPLGATRTHAAASAPTATERTAVAADIHGSVMANAAANPMANTARANRYTPARVASFGSISTAVAFGLGVRAGLFAFLSSPRKLSFIAALL